MEDGNKIIEQYEKQMKGLREKIKKLEKKNKKLEKKNEELESDASWRWENDLQESRRKNELGRLGIFG